MNISIIGYGNMGKALCEGLLSNPNYQLQVVAPSLSRGEPAPRLKTQTTNVAVLSGADMVILAIKPAQMRLVLAEITPHLAPTVLIISIAAGLNLAWYAKYLPQHTPLVRAMPNLAVACRQSATPLLANSAVTIEQHAAASAVFQHCGSVTWIKNETDLDTITALSGSGLAYLFGFAQAMCESAIALGLSQDIATSFARQTLIGAASLAELPGQSLTGLQQKITSKAGTTAAALEVFAQHHLTDTVFSAMQAAVVRSQILRSEEP